MARGKLGSLALVGMGYWGKNLLRTLNSMGALAAAFDKDEKVVEKYLNDRLYKDVYLGTNWEVCLGRKEVKSVVIATPPKTHYDIAMASLNAGKHIFVEKPLTLDIEEAEEIVRVAKEKNLIVMVGHIFLYAPEIMKLKEVVSSENFGAIRYIYTKRLNLGQVQDCGVIDDLMPHDISVIDFLLGKKCKSVSANGISSVLTGIEDVAFVTMDYGEAKAHLHLSWLDPLKVRDTVVVGTKQMVVCDSINKKIDIYNKNVDLSAMEESMSMSYARHLLAYKYGDVVSPYIETFEPLMKECQEFVYAVTNNTPILSNGNVGLDVVKTITAAKISLANSGAWVRV